MKKAIKENIDKIGAAVFMLVLCALFANRFIHFYDSQFAQLKTTIEEHFSIPPKEPFLKRLFWDYLRTTNRKYANSVIVMNDGRFIIEIKPNKALLAEKAEDIAGFSNYLKDKDTPFLFVRVPNAMRDNSQMPRGFENTVVEDTAWFMGKLKENRVDVLDLREVMTSENIDFSTAFFKGDGHWTAETALWAYGKTANYMNNEYGFSLDEKTWNKQEYEIVTYNKAFMGYASGRIGDSRLKEDISVLIPRFSTAFEVYDKAVYGKGNVANNYVAAGDFVDIFVPKTKNDNNDTFEYADLNATRPGYITEYRNIGEGADKKKVLLIADSFAFAFVTYLLSDLECVDLLILGNEANKMLYPLLDSEKYDLVLFLVYDAVLLSRDEGDVDYKQQRMYLGKP
jgi:hypothetical protein